MKNIAYSLVMILVCCFTACTSDDSNYGGKELGVITIAGSDADEMPQINIDLGNNCVITPDIKVSNGNVDDITYTWSVGTYNNGVKGELEEVGNERDFNYFFKDGGAYYAHLVATNGETGAVMDYQINVNRTFEEGIIIVSNDENGNGNLGFIKTLTYEDMAAGKEMSVMEHCLSRMNDNMEVKGLLGASRITTDYTGATKKMIVALADKFYFVDPSTFEIIGGDSYSSVHSGFKGSMFVIDDTYMSYPFVYDTEHKEFCHIDKEYQFAYQNAAKFYTLKFDDVYPIMYDYWGMDYPSPVYVNYSTSEIFEYSAYTDDQFSNALSSGSMFAAYDILSVFKNKAAGTTYVMAVEKANPKHVCQFAMSTTWTGSYGVDYREVYNNPTVFDYEATSTESIPTQGTRFIDNKGMNVVYYYKGGKVYAYYAYNAQPTLPTSPVLSFDGETVTSLSIKDATHELYVGTYNETTKRGSVYVYDAFNLQPGAKPIYSFKDCAGKITDIRYKSK